MDRGSWQATVQGLTEESDMTELLSTLAHHQKLSRGRGEPCECCCKTGKGQRAATLTLAWLGQEEA